MAFRNNPPSMEHHENQASSSRSAVRSTQWSSLGFSKIIVVILLSTAFSWVSCNRQPTTWQVDIAVPVFDDLLDWKEMFVDSLVMTNPGEVATIVFNGPVSEWNIASLTQLPDTIVSQELTPDFVGGPFQVPPGSVLLDTEEDIVFQGIDQQFTQIVLESGRIEYFVESSTDGYVELQYSFPSVTIAGLPVELAVVLPPSSSGQFQTEQGVIDLSGAAIDLTGISGNEINRIASRLIIGTPADILDTAQVYGSDSIRVSMHFQDLLVQQVAGYFGQEVLDFDVSQTVFDPDVFSGFVEIQPTRANLEFHNTIAADIRLTLDAFAVDGMAMSHPAIGTPQLIARADWSSGEVVPAIWQMNLLETAPSLFDMLSHLPELIVVEGDGLLNPLGDVSGGHDFFDTRVPPELILDLEWPLVGTIDQFGFERDLEFGGMDLRGFQGDLVIRMTNGFPVEWLVDAEWEFLDALIDPVVLEGVVDAFGAMGEEASHEYELRLPVDEARIGASSVLRIGAQMSSEGRVEFTGRERLRLQVTFEGTYDVIVE